MNKKLKEFFFTDYTKEVYKNNQYNNYPNLLSVIQLLKDNIIQSLQADERIKFPGIANRYILETKERITQITTHDGLDLLIKQYHKKNKEFVNYSPYSDPGYYIFIHLMTAYGHLHRREKDISFDFHVTDEDEKERSFRTNPMKDDVRGSMYFGNAGFYLTEGGIEMKTDCEGISRIGSSPDWHGFGLQNDTTVLQFPTWMGHKKEDTRRLVFENDLLPLYMQLYINITRYVSGGSNAVNIKKLYEYIRYAGLSLQNNHEKTLNFIERIYPDRNSSL